MPAKRGYRRAVTSGAAGVASRLDPSIPETLGTFPASAKRSGETLAERPGRLTSPSETPGCGKGAKMEVNALYS